MTAAGVLVTGDLVVDHHVYEGRRQHNNQPLHDGVHVRAQLGGAALVASVLGELLPPGTVHLHPPASLSGTQRSTDSAYAFWRPFPQKEARERQWWRVAEAMGFGAHSGELPQADLPPSSSADVAVVVLADGGLGFRDTPASWPERALASARWVVLKVSAPVGEGALWNHLVSHHRDRLVVVVAARELRQSSGRVSTGSSWEDTLGGLVAELQPNRAFQALTRCRHLIVSFESEGAAWLDMEGAAPRDAIDGTRVHVVHDASVIEGERASAVEGLDAGTNGGSTTGWALS